MIKDSREHILETSLMLFLQKGFKSSTMNDIVKKSGLSKGAFYYYFKSKEQVFEEVVSYFYKDLLTQNFDSYSQNSLKEFYLDFLKDADQKFFTLKRFGNSIEETWNVNHYFLIFDALFMLPAFKNLKKDQDANELIAWKKIIKVAKKSREIHSNLSDEQIARLFIMSGDGFGMKIIMDTEVRDRLDVYRKESRKLWGALYNLLKT